MSLEDVAKLVKYREEPIKKIIKRYEETGGVNKLLTVLSKKQILKKRQTDIVNRNLTSKISTMPYFPHLRINVPDN